MLVYLIHTSQKIVKDLQTNDVMVCSENVLVLERSRNDRDAD